MATTNQQQQREILKLAIGQLDTMLTLATTMRIQQYLLRKNASGFRDFEEEVAHLDDQIAIHGTGVLADRQNILRRPNRWDDDNFMPEDVPLGSHELGAYIDSFPLDAAGSSYVFTLLEVFGNDVAAIVSPGSISRNKAWHEDVKGFADLRDPNQVTTAQAAFGKHFGIAGPDVPEIAARRMVELKRIRNEFAHDGSGRVDFEGFLKDVVAIVCHIVFLTTDEDRLSSYPWEDHMKQFDPQTKV
ncbi:hypothetical protein [Aureimonas sp. AU40]|uniref:hypothetical protein n=1 Tax=Aureimonas sp. AU40 TaxID=1637747 RepID=UPI000781674F|nr:hypothetical protein [Aureimonas sp. AU40]